mgnify:CR=1 FL=1
MSTPQTRSARKTAARGASTSAKRLLVLVATRKGAWFFHSDAKRKTFTADGPHFLGHNISHVQLDPRDDRAAPARLASFG